MDPTFSLLIVSTKILLADLMEKLSESLEVGFEMMRSKMVYYVWYLTEMHPQICFRLALDKMNHSSVEKVVVVTNDNNLTKMYNELGVTEKPHVRIDIY